MEEMQEDSAITVCINDTIARLPELRFKKPVSWILHKGEQWAVIGPNGSGKTLLADIVQCRTAIEQGDVIFGFEGKASDLVRSIAFKDVYSLADYRNSYYQQRWHATESEDMPTVRELLSGDENSADYQELLTRFDGTSCLSKKIIYLSSGELRKFLILRTLLKHPRILILDNPFIGLDGGSRKLLVEVLHSLAQLNGLQIILLLCNPADIPDMVTNVLSVKDRDIIDSSTRQDFLNNEKLISDLFVSETSNGTVLEEPALPVNADRLSSDHDVTFRMEHIHIKYGKRTILKDLNWEVRNGEKWLLSGPNGSGKSTLLSLIYADNPQAYSNTLYLFDRKRGTGESIWEIKKRIGYVSPEMHIYYMENVPAVDIVGSGFFDSIGLYRTCTPQQFQEAKKWMSVFGIEKLERRLFLSLSSGEQRLVLLARAFVKDPDLLILDEPLHGLDVTNKKKVGQIISRFCTRPGKTLIYVTHYPNEIPKCVDKHFELIKHT